MSSIYVFTPRIQFIIYHVLLADCIKQALAGALIHRRQTIYWIFTQAKLPSIYRHSPIVTY